MNDTPRYRALREPSREVNSTVRLVSQAPDAGIAVKTVQFTVPGKYTTEYWKVQ
ncbi:protein of unknown function [Ralstonia solanacearum CMR15]|nr:protein of unknown function [Ralstonia solanacearum CMR15]